VIYLNAVGICVNLENHGNKKVVYNNSKILYPRNEEFLNDKLIEVYFLVSSYKESKYNS